MDSQFKFLIYSLDSELTEVPKKASKNMQCLGLILNPASSKCKRAFVNTRLRLS